MNNLTYIHDLELPLSKDPRKNGSNRCENGHRCASNDWKAVIGKLADIEKTIYEMAGEKFNINSLNNSVSFYLRKSD